MNNTENIDSNLNKNTEVLEQNNQEKTDNNEPVMLVDATDESLNVDTDCYPYAILRDDFDTTLESNQLFNEGKTIPFQFFPKIFKDERGCFAENLTSKEEDWMNSLTYWFKNAITNTKQINRSYSNPGVFRGFHAQKKPFCQGKLVECLSETPIWDIIIDARPDSTSFQQFTIFRLTANTMSKVWIPAGFLHAIVIPKLDLIPTGENASYNQIEYHSPAILQYFVDNYYDKDSEITVNPDSILHVIAKQYFDDFMADQAKNIQMYGLLKAISDGLTYSEKDKNGINYLDFIKEVDEDYKSKNVLWYK